MEKRTIRVRLSYLFPEFEMTFSIPEGERAEGYIFQVLYVLTSGMTLRDIEWDFV